ncbi:MAG: cation:proton antiporter [Thermoflavifilum sp.]|nr:cation:proton antiporter [Thermoflavifilum sp.]MCL6515046.1 cation:proton antiporter [Alicyclobacillus sp.]
MFSLAAAALARFLLAFVLLLAGAHLLGWVAERLAIPRVIGEVASGLVLGPTLLGTLWPGAFHWLFQGFSGEGTLFGLFYQLGVIFLMFTAGLKFQTRFEKADVKLGVAIILGSTVIPFVVGWLVTYLFDPLRFLGPDHNLTALRIVIAISIAVTSIPVISKIFSDLGIMHSRFAKIIVSVAGVHDLILWATLAVASGLVSAHHGSVLVSAGRSLGVTLAFLVVCIVVLPWVLRRITMRRWNILFRASFLGYCLIILFALADIAGYLQVDVMYGALLAGIATRFSLPQPLFERLQRSLEAIAFSLFIPVYFGIVGLQLNLARSFPIGTFLLYLLLATAVQTIVVYVTCRLVRQDQLTSLNLAAAMNARGGPGIVLSSTAYALGIINEPFFAILVMLALVTSWMAGSWLRFVLRTGRRLMPGDEGLEIRPVNEEFLEPARQAE